MHIKQIVISGFLILNFIFINNINSNTNITKLTSKDLNLTTIELADTSFKQVQGLMYRDKLCSQCAMLFVYNYPTKSAFWMKNTKISLDIIFINNEGKIINIHANTEPYNTSKYYYPESLYYYALETNAGFADINKLKPGLYLDIADLMLVAGLENRK